MGMPTAQPPGASALLHAGPSSQIAAKTSIRKRIIRVSPLWKRFGYPRKSYRRFAGEELASPRAAGESGDYAALTNRVKITVGIAQTALAILFAQSEKSSGG